MNKIKLVNGYCPTQDTDYSISVTYIDASTLQGTHFIKGLFMCPYNRSGDKCSCKCPIYNNAPEEL
ncbi:MAG: hypothetical protein KH020_10740 [Clostridiales bacterium]|nr:hypothetical protein [Clostridiales bacterium]